ncbi:ribonuclease H-like domain-containing protein [Tanacetum coccineum]
MNSLISPIRSIGGRSIGAVPLEYHLNYMDMVDYFAKREVEPRQKSIEEQEILPELNFFIKTQYGLQAKRNGGLEQNAFPHKDKAGLGYDSQMNESKVVNNVFNSKESDVDDSPVNDRFKTGEGFHAVPPSYTRNYMPSRTDLSFAGLDDSVYKAKDIDSDNDSVFRPKPDQTKPKFTKINFVKSNENVISVNKENTHRQEEYPRKIRRAFNQKSAAKTNNLNEKVKTARVNNVTTAGPKAVVSAAVGNGENAVKSLACWIWRTKQGNGNPQYTLQDQGIFDSGCSRHMTGNKSFLIDYQEVDGGFVAFAGSPKGGKITRKENSVLFTKTECLVLSPDFKLLDESQVLLKVPRQNNMYSFDLKNVVPSGGLTCLFAKATIDESNLWHRRLGHINFKTMNKLVKGNLVRGLPSKLFKNDHTCVACQKGKQHKASCLVGFW